MSVIRRFTGSRDGNIAITFGLVITVLILVIGCAIDYARGVWAQRDLQQATDSTVLLVSGRTLTNSEANVLALQTLKLNAAFADPKIESLTLPSANSVKKTKLVRAIGEVTRSISKMDVVMVLDNSGSMTTDNRIGNLKAAAIDAVNILTTNNPEARIGLVPFNLFVNVGSKYQSATWLNDAMPSQHLVAATRKSPGGQSSVKRFELFTALGVTWAGCVEARTGGLDVTDDPPATAASAFVPAFAPDDPGTQATANDATYNALPSYNTRSSFVNHYVNDDGDCQTASTSVTDALKQDRTCKYFKNTVNTLYNSSVTPRRMGPNLYCSALPLTRLSSSVSDLTTAINAMVPDGGTNIAEGVAWGFRVLSRNAPFADGMSAADVVAGGRRYMIVMTDGDNQLVALNNQNGSTYSAYGYKSDTGNRLPGTVVASTYGNAGMDAMNQKMLATCSNAKTAGIVIYSIGVSVTTPAAVTALTSCASTSANAYFITSSASLSTVFRSIANQINAPYLSQ